MGVIMRKWDGHRLRGERQKLLISQRDLASACGCSISFIANIERGRQSPNIDILCKIVDYLKLESVDVLCHGEAQ